MLSSLLRKMERPVFSIVVATYNRPHQLRTLLRSLTSIDYPRERFEVIVVDDGSRMPLESAIAGFQTQLNLCLLRQSHSGVASARQAGVERAQGVYLAFTDDDCQPASRWLRVLEDALTHTSGRAAGGRILNGLPRNPYSTATQTLEDYLRSHWNRDPAGITFFGTANLAMPADLCRSIGGFDVREWPNAGEDRDLCARWTEGGYSFVYAADAVVHHHHELNLFTFLRQHFGYGRGAFRVRQASAQRGRRKIKVEPLSFYFRLPLFGLKEAPGWEALLIATLLVVAQVSNAAGFIWDWARQRTPRVSTEHADLHHRL
jgi:glycosyltransferase involved in cell wall biosynthesis